MNCLDSYDYIHAINQLQRGETLTDVDRFLLYECWAYVPFLSLAKPSSTIEAIPIESPPKVYDQLLSHLEHALKQPSIVNASALTYIFERCQQLLLIRPLPSFDHHASIIIDHLITLLQTEQSLTIIVLKALQRLSTHPDFRPIMQQRQISTHLLPFTNDHQHERQRTLALAILAQVIDEKQLTTTDRNTADQMMSVFIDQLQHLDPRRYSAELDTTLASLQGKTTRILTCSLQRQPPVYSADAARSNERAVHRARWCAEACCLRPRLRDAFAVTTTGGRCR